MIGENARLKNKEVEEIPMSRPKKEDKERETKMEGTARRMK